jgi:hypothetical protein
MWRTANIVWVVRSQSVTMIPMDFPDGQTHVFSAIGGVVCSPAIHHGNKEEDLMNK